MVSNCLQQTAASFQKQTGLKLRVCFSHTLQHCMYPRSLAFSAFFRSIAITGPQWQNRTIDSNTKNTLEYPLSLHITDLSVEL